METWYAIVEVSFIFLSLPSFGCGRRRWLLFLDVVEDVVRELEAGHTRCACQSNFEKICTIIPHLSLVWSKLDKTCKICLAHVSHVPRPLITKLYAIFERFYMFCSCFYQCSNKLISFPNIFQCEVLKSTINNSNQSYEPRVKPQRLKIWKI